MNEPLAYLNGRLIPQSAAHLDLHDAGFVLGATVTDLCRTFRHRLFRWADHLARFRQSCAAAYLNFPIDDAELTRRAEELVEHNARLLDAAGDLALVVFATPGPVGFYLGQPTAAGEQPTFGMHTFPLPFARYRPWIEHGVALVTPAVRAIPAACIDPHIKHRSRLHWWLADQEARRIEPGAQALLLDMDGHITETASSNFLLVKNGEIISPRRETILDGVSLRVVAELCERFDTRLTHRDISLEECYAADEAILTCTSYCLAGVRRLNGHPLPWPGPMLGRLAEAWSAMVGLDVHAQIVGA